MKNNYSEKFEKMRMAGNLASKTLDMLTDYIKAGISTNKIDRPQSMQLDLRGMRVDPALLELEQFFDRALISGMNQVNILHGKGTGALMEAVGEFLKGQSFIKNFNFAHENHGGAGITEVEFK